MHDAANIRARFMHRAVDDEASGVDAVRRVADDGALEVDLDQVRGGDLVEGETERVGQEMMLRLSANLRFA
jgi:hypothetical protein